MPRMRGRIAGLVVALAGFLVLAMPLLINGGPIYWFDTLAYLHGGGTAIESLTGIETRYDAMKKTDAVDVFRLEKGAVQNASPAVPDLAPQDAISSTQDSAATTDSGASGSAGGADYQISQARSAYYAVALSALSVLGGSAAPALLAVFLLVLAGMALLRAVFDGRLVVPGLWLVAGAAVSSIGVVAALLMPDVLAPLSILSVAVFFAFYDRLNTRGKFFWAVLLVISAVSHSTHVVVAIFLLPIGMLLAACLGRKFVFKPALWCAASLAITLGAGAGFTQAVQALYGYKPLSLPMIAASLITDAPGRSFLEETCPDVGYIYCDQLNTRATETDQFLWSTDPEIGVYQFADLETRRTMSEQQFDFFLDTLRHDWTGQVSISLGRFWKQLFEDGLDQTTYNDARRHALQKLPEPDKSRVMESGLYRGTVSFVGFGRFAHYAALIAALAAFGTIAARWSRHAERYPPAGDASLRALTVFALLLLAGVLANAGLTGAFSQPQGRYATRVMVLMPLLAAIMAAWTARNQVPFKERLTV